MTSPDTELPPFPPGARRLARGDILAVYKTRGLLASHAGDYLALLLSRAVARHGRAVAALAGGTTPGPAYAELARRELDWERIDLLLTDERLVPADHPDSNYRIIRDHLGTGPRVWPMVPPGAPEPLDASALARDYADRITTLVTRRDSGIPVLDLVLLGLGRDGHIASLFPGSPVLHETKAWVVPAPGPSHGETGSPDRERLTLSLSLVNAAEVRVMLVAGEEKRLALHAALGWDHRTPTGHVELAANATVWFADTDARKGSRGPCE